MIRTWRTISLVVLGLSAIEFSTAEAQIKVQGAKTVVITPGSTVERQTLVVRRRRPWRERNPFFLARPNYAPAAPGQRASVTFEPLSSLYYPTEGSFYPPRPTTTVVTPR